MQSAKPCLLQSLSQLGSINPDLGVSICSMAVLQAMHAHRHRWIGIIEFHHLQTCLVWGPITCGMHIWGSNVVTHLSMHFAPSMQCRVENNRLRPGLQLPDPKAMFQVRYELLNAAIMPYSHAPSIISCSHFCEVFQT